MHINKRKKREEKKKKKAIAIWSMQVSSTVKGAIGQYIHIILEGENDVKTGDLFFPNKQIIVIWSIPLRGKIKYRQ